MLSRTRWGFLSSPNHPTKILHFLLDQLEVVTIAWGNSIVLCLCVGFCPSLNQLTGRKDVSLIGLNQGWTNFFVKYQIVNILSFVIRPVSDCPCCNVRASVDSTYAGAHGCAPVESNYKNRQLA